MAKRASAPPQKAGFMRRIGSRAGFAIAAIGLVFAAYQVQGWKMPGLLAAVLIACLLAIATIALLSIAWEAIKEIRAWRERRETSTAWIADEPPGLLDYLPDMNRALKKFVRQMGRLNHDTERLGRQTGRDARTASLAKFFGPRAAQSWANHTARRVLRSAVFIEKRSTHLRKTILELGRAQEGHLKSLPAVKSGEERAALRSARAAVASQSATVEETIRSVCYYRDVVRGISEQNFSRTLRVSNQRLADQLSGVVEILRLSLKHSKRMEGLLEQRERAYR
jgi:hypothetical protein